MKGRERGMKRGGEGKFLEEGEIEEEGKVKSKGKWERGRKKKRRADTTSRAAAGPDIPTLSRLRGRPGLRIAEGRAVRSAHLADPERPPPQPCVLPERRRMDGRPPRTGSRCAPMCRLRGRQASGQRTAQARSLRAESAVRAPCPPARPPAVTSSRPCRPLAAA